MANITIKELLAADKVSELVDKINFNFDQLLLNGGGPKGGPGGPGIQGPIGPRGTSWFTANDLLTTSDSPSWSGTPVKANSQLLPGFPQYKGDPNRFRPVAPTGVSAPLPWLLPEHTYTLSTPTKPVRGGDLYLQEVDDTFNSQASLDGDIWEYNATTLVWDYTGVNIKGNDGTAGSAANSEWIRITSGLDDLIYPKNISGQDVARLLIGQYSNVLNLDNSNAILTINTDSTHIALNHPSIHSKLVNPGNEELGATIQVISDGKLSIQGSNVQGIGLSREIVISSFDESIIIAANGGNYIKYTQDPILSKHIFDGGAININHHDIPGLRNINYRVETGPTTAHLLTQKFTPADGVVDISTAATGYPGPNGDAFNAPHLILLKEGSSLYKNVGIGYFPSPQVPGSKLSVSGSLSVGSGYRTLVSPDANGAIIEGRVGIGTSTFPANSYHKLQVNGSIIIGSDNEILGQNIFWNPTLSGFTTMIGGPGTSRASWFIKQHPTAVDTDANLSLIVFPITIPGSITGSNPVSNPPSSAAINIKQGSNAALGKIGLNIGGFATDSRLTINDTDGTGLHFIRFTPTVSGANQFFNSLSSGARIWHTASSTQNGSTVWGPISVDRTFNIYQFEPADFKIGHKSTFTGAEEAKIVIKSNGFIGINNSTPRHIVTIRGRDSQPETVPVMNNSIPDPDEINIGTFEDTSITGLTVSTFPDGDGNQNDITNIQGGAYIGFNAWFEKQSGPTPSRVAYGNHEAGGFSLTAGAIIFADANGNLHFANYEERDTV